MEANQETDNLAKHESSLFVHFRHFDVILSFSSIPLMVGVVAINFPRDLVLFFFWCFAPFVY
jgi:hypothetical protein